MEKVDLPDPFCISLGSDNCLALVKFLNAALLVDVPNADVYLLFAICLLILLALAQQFDVFTRPPPVPTKELPRRPALQVIFKPDDVIVGSATAAAGASSVAADEQEPSHVNDEISIFPATPTGNFEYGEYDFFIAAIASLRS